MENSRLYFRAWHKEAKGFYYFNIFDLRKYSLDEFDDDNIEQCTGIKDKNGKLIYAGDIITDGVDIFEVVWDYNAWCIQTNKFQHFLTEGFEVIGNIHENKDLLEGKI